MKLGIITDSHHSLDENGSLYNHNPILAKQFQCWMNLFEKVIICAPLIDGSPPEFASAYVGAVQLIPIRLAGGKTLTAKLRLMSALPGWLKAIHRLLDDVDAVHVRCPNNISIPALFALMGSNVYKQALYTGTWMGYPAEPLTFALQRFLLRRFFRGPVAVYGSWPDQPDHIVPTFSPSHSTAEWEQEYERIQGKIEQLRQIPRLSEPLRLLTVGMLRSNKKQETIIRAVALLKQRNISAGLTILGDGPDREKLETLVCALGLKENIEFAGRVSYEQVRRSYRECDFVVQAPIEEGFGKVPLEALVHGAVPVLADTNLSSIFVGAGSRGMLFPALDEHALANVLSELANKPQEVVRMILNGREYVLQFTLERWQAHLREMLESFWGIPVEPERIHAV